MLGGQLHNSSGWPSELPQVWESLAALHANTVEAPVYWEQVEATAGRLRLDQRRRDRHRSPPAWSSRRAPVVRDVEERQHALRPAVGEDRHEALPAGHPGRWRANRRPHADLEGVARGGQGGLHGADAPSQGARRLRPHGPDGAGRERGRKHRQRARLLARGQCVVREGGAVGSPCGRAETRRHLEGDVRQRRRRDLPAVSPGAIHQRDCRGGKARVRDPCVHERLAELSAGRAAGTALRVAGHPVPERRRRPEVRRALAEAGAGDRLHRARHLQRRCRVRERRAGGVRASGQRALGAGSGQGRQLREVRVLGARAAARSASRRSASIAAAGTSWEARSLRPTRAISECSRRWRRRSRD